MAKANLTVPIIIDWKDIEEYLAQHDIVEVVRCKECKHFTAHWNPNFPCGTCSIWGDSAMTDDYCSYAERRTDAD